jgi:hypothetical protein
MNRFGLSARDRRTAVAGITTVGSLILVSRGLPALREWERTQLANASDVIGRASSARAKLRALPSRRDSLARRQQELSALDSAILTEASPAAAVADLAAMLDDMAGSAGVRIATVQLRADSAPRRAIARIGVRVAGTTDVAGLAELLRLADTADTLLVVRELSASQAEPAAPQTRPEALRIELLVEAMARIAAPHSP